MKPRKKGGSSEPMRLVNALRAYLGQAPICPNGRVGPPSTKVKDHVDPTFFRTLGDGNSRAPRRGGSK